MHPSILARGVAIFLVSALIAGCQGDSKPQPDQSGDPSNGTKENGEVPTPVVENPWFENATEGSGIDFVHHSGGSPIKPFPSANGSGIGAFDYDLDGLPDLFFASGTDFPVNATTSEFSDRLYRNLGTMKFTDVSEAAGVDFRGYSVGVAIGDYDNDGFPDLYVSSYGVNLLYHNQGDGSFVRVEEPAGVADEEWATSPMFFDSDGDGNLDVYICNYGYWNLDINGECYENRVRVYCSPKTIKPCVDSFYRSQGDSTFVDAGEEAGVAGRAGRAQGVVAADLDGNGSMDLYLGNDLNANSFFLNDGMGKYADESELSGVAYDNRGNSQAGMGVDSADFNRDGKLDLLVTNFRNEYNSLYEARQPGLFFEVSSAKGLALDSYPYVAWGTAFADFDLDGWMDLFVVNGHVDDNRLDTGEDAPYRNPDLVWRNRGGTFECLRESAGDYFSEVHCGRGMVLVDLDRDGDEDVVVGHQDEAPSLVRNLVLPLDPEASSANKSSIQIQWVGTRSNRSGIGVRFSHKIDGKLYADQVTGGGSYLSCHEYLSTFAVPADSQPVSIQVQFLGGQEHTVADLEPAGRYLIIEGNQPGDPPTLRRIDHIQ